MALNVTFDGYTYDKDEIISNSDINYQGFFYNNGTASSSPKWNTVRTVEGTGYFNINLGDSDWLNQEGIVISNSKVIIVFWKDAHLGDNRNALTLDEWGAVEITIDGSSVYTQDCQVKDNLCSILQWGHNVPVHGYVNTTYSTTNTSYDVHSWMFDGILSAGSVIMNHYRTRYSEDIQLINTVTGTNYYWGDTKSTLGLNGAASSNHQWDTAGTYDINIEVLDESGCTTSGSSTIEIFWHAPVPNIVCNEAVGQNIITPDTVISFNYTGSDVDGSITGIDWIITDVGVYGNTTTTIYNVDSSTTVYHTSGMGTSWNGHSASNGAFTNPGDHLVSIVIHLDDGHSSQIINYNETFNQNVFNGPPVPNIQCYQAVGQNISTPDTAVVFSYIGSNPDDRIVDIDWEINDVGIYGNTTTILNGIIHSSDVSHSSGEGYSWCGDTATLGAFTNPGNHIVDIDVNWNDGWEDYVVDYQETFNQGLFSGPAINFNQLPVQATVGSGVIFENTSTDVSRVGKHLPECREYDWVWIDNEVSDTTENVGYNDDLEKIPGSANCSVKLIGYWNDGWALHTAELEKDVVFKTTIDVSIENCYYNLHIIGTSSDGTVTGYQWEIYQDTISGTGIGPWTQVWESPIDLEQNDKKISFTAVSYYKIIGYVSGNGTTTYDDEIIYVSTVCPVDAINYVWNGTGSLDIGTDWTHVGYGIENTESMHTGTNGLDLTGLSNGSTFHFDSYKYVWVDVDVTNYDFLLLWVYVNSWEQTTNLQVSLDRDGVFNSTVLNLDDYINLTIIKQWQKVYIPLNDFNIPAGFGQLKYVNTLNFVSQGNIDLYIDDITFVMGNIFTEVFAVCNPTVTTRSIGTKSLDGKEISPSMKVESVLPNVSSPIIEGREIGSKDVEFNPMIPNMKAIMDRQSSDRIIHTFPPPKNT